MCAKKSLQLTNTFTPLFLIRPMRLPFPELSNNKNVLVFCLCEESAWNRYQNCYLLLGRKEGGGGGEERGTVKYYYSSARYRREERGGESNMKPLLLSLRRCSVAAFLTSVFLNLFVRRQVLRHRLTPTPALLFTSYTQ